MIKTELSKKISQIFLPAFLLSVFLSGSSALCHLAQHILEVDYLNFSAIPILQSCSIFLKIVFAAILFVFSLFKPFEKIFRGALLTLIGIASLLTGLTFFPQYLLKWPVSLLYVVFSLMEFNLPALLVWGFVNRITSLSEGIKYYIALAFVLSFTEMVGTLVKNSMLFAETSQWSFIPLVIFSLAFMACALVLFNQTWKKLPDSVTHPERQPPVIPKIRFPFLSSAYLLAGCVVIRSFLDFPFKFQVRTEFSDPGGYSSFMAYFSLTSASSALLISMVWAILGTWLIWKKGWRVAAMYGSLSVLIGGVVFLTTSTAIKPASWLNQGLFTGLLVGTTSALFFPLIQILYLSLPYQNRFRTKIATEMIALPLMKELPGPLMPTLLTVGGSIGELIFLLKIFALILIVLLVFASKRASSKFDQQLSVNYGHNH